MREPRKTIFVVVDEDGRLCDLADTKRSAQETADEINHETGVTHRVVQYQRVDP